MEERQNFLVFKYKILCTVLRNVLYKFKTYLLTMASDFSLEVEIRQFCACI